MELYEAIKTTIEQHGTEIIKEDRFANILLDLNAYERLPSARFILKILISYNFIGNVLYLSSAADKKSFVHTASENLGFKEEALLYVVECLHFGLGISKKEPTLKVKKRRTTKPKETIESAVKTEKKEETAQASVQPTTSQTKPTKSTTPKKRATPKKTAPKSNPSPSVAQEIISAMVRAFLRNL